MSGFSNPIPLRLIGTDFHMGEPQHLLPTLRIPHPRCGPGCDDYLGPVSAMVEDRCPVARFEQRSCGRSDWDGQYALTTTMDDIAFVRQAYGFEKIIIAGHSAGVNFALAYALKYSQSTLGIIDIAGARIVNDREWYKTYREKLETIGEDNGGQVYYADPAVNKVGNASWRQFTKRLTLLREVATLTMPATFINAEDDIHPNWPSIQLAHLLLAGEYVEIVEAGHYIWITHANELRQALQTAVARCR